jgi:glyoxalase family protein
MELGGLHHVSAITGNAPGNVAFYTNVLGLRLVKKTVNQDDTSMYHLFYGDEVGQAGTEMTFFDWPMASPHQAGTGMISTTAFRVADMESLGWWARRFAQVGVPFEEVIERDGRAVLRFTDPEGQRLELVDDTQFAGSNGVPRGTPWDRSPVPVGPARSAAWMA